MANWPLIVMSIQQIRDNEEYRCKLDQLSENYRKQIQGSSLPRVRLFLAPIMDREARRVFSHIESHVDNPKWVRLHGANYVCAIIRSIIGSRIPPNLRIRQGVLELMGCLGTDAKAAIKSLKNFNSVRKLVLKPGDRPELVGMIETYLKWLDNQTTTLAVSQDLHAQAYRESQERLFEDEQQRKSRVLSEHEKRRLLAKAKLRAEQEAQSRVQRRVERKREPKPATRYLVD